MRDKILLDLRQFDGEAGSAGAGEGESATGENVEVLYGKQDTAAGAAGQQGETTQQAEPPDLEREFKELTAKKGGKYAKQYRDSVEKIVQQRVGEMNELKTQVQSYAPILNVLQARYGESDLGKLAQLVSDDTALYEEQAAEAGMDVHTYMNIQKLQRENAALKQQQQEADKQAFAARQVNEWVQQEQALKEMYPDFDLMEEIGANPEFANMLDSGVTVENAFRVLHFDELMNAAQRSASETAMARYQESVRQNGLRPAENGVKQNAGVIVKNDPSQLSDRDIDDILVRVARGEKISF